MRTHGVSEPGCGLGDDVQSRFMSARCIRSARAVRCRQALHPQRRAGEYFARRYPGRAVGGPQRPGVRLYRRPRARPLLPRRHPRPHHARRRPVWPRIAKDPRGATLPARRPLLQSSSSNVEHLHAVSVTLPSASSSSRRMPAANGDVDHGGDGARRRSVRALLDQEHASRARPLRRCPRFAVSAGPAIRARNAAPSAGEGCQNSAVRCPPPLPRASRHVHHRRA